MVKIVMQKECSKRSNELVLTEFDKLTIIAKEETKFGKMRQPRFISWRFDKTEENFG